MKKNSFSIFQAVLSAMLLVISIEGKTESAGLVQNASQSPNVFLLSGRLTSVGSPVSDATITLSGTVSRTTVSTADGYYFFSSLPEGGTYTITVSPTADYIFTPNSQTIPNLNANRAVNFSATEICTTPNCRTNGRIAFIRANDLYTANQEGTEEVRLTSSAAIESDPRYSPDGTKIIFVSDFEIYTINTDGTNILRLTNNSATESYPSFSPDGTKILFISNRDGNSEIYTMNADGSNAIRLTNNTDMDASPIFSPDGGKIAFFRQTTASSFPLSAIYTMNADGSNTVQLTNPPSSPTLQSDSRPLYSPDGLKIIFLRFDSAALNTRIMVMNADGSSQNAIRTGVYYRAAYSPNGKKIIYSEQVQGVNRVDVKSLSGQQEKVLISNATSSDWQPLRPAITKTSFDFDGDRRADVSVFRPDNGIWFLNQSQNGFSGLTFGFGTDKLVPADYDGDGKTDIAVYRGGNWYLQRSQTGFSGVSFGAADDIPVPADYDGDGRADIAVFRPSNGTWYLLRSQLGSIGITFGQAGDRPIPADYDGDGTTDIAVNRAGSWYIQRSQLGFTGILFGDANDKLIPADYDGDGRADIAVFRPLNGYWYLQQSTAGFAGFPFGFGTDIPVPADYDGDGRADIAVVRNGNWYIQRTAQGFASIAFGTSTDLPVPNTFVR